MAGLTFAEMLKLIEDRSAALRAGAGEAGLAARVPGCPDWNVGDLLAHLGEVQRFWAASVTAGPAAGPPGADPGRQPPPDDADLMAWSGESTGQLIAALAAAGPDRGCWTWWTASGAPQTAGAVARHQVQEAGVHAFDAQEAAGRAEPLPAAAAADGIGEFLTVGMASMGPWPAEPGCVALVPDDASAWVISLTEAGARAEAEPGDGTGGRPAPGATLRGTASDLVLALYGRHLHGALAIEGDGTLAARLLSWSSSD